jgi:dihydrofolate synthase/folylpolyglutamate synthase
VLVAGALVDQDRRAARSARRRHNAEGVRGPPPRSAILEERVSRPLVVITGMMANKDADAFSPISPG